MNRDFKLNGNNLILRNGLIVFLSMLIAIVSVGVLKISINNIIKEYEYIINECDTNSEDVLFIKSYLFNHKALVYSYVNSTNDSQRMYYKAGADDIEDAVTPVFGRLKESMTGESTKELYHKMFSESHAYLRSTRSVFLLAKSGSITVAMQELEKNDIYLGDVSNIVNEMRSLIDEERLDAYERLEKYRTISKRVSTGIFILLIATLFVSVYLSVRTSKLMTEIDPLTGVKNVSRITYEYSIRKKRGRLTDYNLILINIKNFRFINKLIGTSEADRVLAEFAQNFKEKLVSGEMFGRIGGDTFVALIHEDHIHEYLRALSTAAVKAYADDYDESMGLPVRVGVYKIDGTEDFAEAVNRASVALKASKDTVASDCVWFEPSMLDETFKTRKIEEAFSKAISEREFVVYYQPKIDMENDVLCGAEALVRWVKDGQILPPAQFISVLESDGQIEILDMYVLDQVCRDLRKWLDIGIMPERVSTNFSKLHFKNPQFIENIITIIKKYDIDPKYIEVELTESLGYEDHDSLLKFIKVMHDEGVTVTMDDFGTGYSSLTMLQNLDFDVIKMDMSFLDGIEEGDLRHETMFKNIVQMIQDLGLEVVCEGVDSIIKADYLKEIGCNIVQGFLYDKPIPKTEFEKRLKIKKYQM